MEVIEKQGAQRAAVSERAHTGSQYPGDILDMFRANKSKLTSLLDILFVILVVYAAC